MNDDRLILTVVTPGDDLEHSAPGGFRLTDQVFSEAGLRDELSATEDGESTRLRLRKIQRTLQRQLKMRVTLRMISPLTPSGLWLVVRHRLREFPCLLIGGKPYKLDTPLDDLLDAVRRTLE